MKKIGFVSLGCPKNTVDTELAMGDLLRNGYEYTADPVDAEVIVVNTCGFIESSKRESIDAILDMARHKEDGKCRRLIVTGCLAERYGEELLREIPEIDHLFGTHQYPALKEVLRKNGAPGPRNHIGEPAQYFESYVHRVPATPFYTTYIKIGEGCSNKCAFCIIPKMRGPFRSRAPESIVEEVRHFAQAGVKEFNLVSQDTTMYGLDLRMKEGPAKLLRQLAAVPGVEWLRLLYCYPTFVTPGLIDCIRTEEKVCNYMDVPLQHIHDDILALMKRQEREKDVRNMLDRLRREVPGVAVRTTFIVGFPGEKDRHFDHLCKFLREAEMDHVGVFAYSNEEGTTAYDYPDQVPHEVAESRRDELMRIQREISLRKNRARIGQTATVLVEGADPEEGYLLTGRLATQAPEIDGQVILEETEAAPGQIIPVRITGAMEYDLIARKAN